MQCGRIPDLRAYLQVGEDEKGANLLTSKMAAIGQKMLAMPGMDDMKDAGPFFANELSTVYAVGDARLEGPLLR